MATVRPRSTGFLSSLRALGDNLLATVQDRLELFSIEVQEEKVRLIQIFIWVSVAVFAGTMALTFASLTLVYLFWENARLAVLGGLTVLYTATLVAIILAIRRALARQPRPFAATLHAIGADRAAIRAGS